MNIDIASFKLLNKEDVIKMVREDELLTEIAMISSLEIADKYKNEFQSKYNNYDFESYIERLERIKILLLKGYSNTNLIIRIIRTNSDRILII